MTARVLLLLCLVMARSTRCECAARYAPTWDSIDSRPTPAWWSDAKFGIFIHWGVYSVPAFAPKGEYAEWYWERIGSAGQSRSGVEERRFASETRAFHERLYGKDFAYPDFAPQFRAEMFDAEQWARHLASARARNTW